MLRVRAAPGDGDSDRGKGGEERMPRDDEGGVDGNGKKTGRSGGVGPEVTLAAWDPADG